MILKSLSLVNYKNFDAINFDFDERINCFVGPNGIGKTNVLDAIYHLSFGKSYFNPITSQNIKHGKDFFVIEGYYQKKDREEKIIVGVKKGAKKTIKRNGKPYDTFAAHIGFLPLVIISPADRDLIVEGSETRRKFIDGVIAQGDAEYLDILLKYNKVLSQRNALLKYFAANHTFDRTTLTIYDEQLHNYGGIIFQKRVAFLAGFVPVFKERYKSISANKEAVDLLYESKLAHAPLQTLLQQNIDRDRALQYTSVGVHKDHLSFKISGYPIKKFGSQGQQKSFLIALKLAQFECIKTRSGITPILLLDDIFDKLDEQRVAHIIELVIAENFEQLFISDTHADRTENILRKISQSYKMITFNTSNE